MAHPLLDRHELTAERTAAVTGHPAAEHQHHSIHQEIAAAAESLAYIHQCLNQLLVQERSDLTQVCVTSRDVAESVMRDFPAPGAKRLIVRRTGSGGVFTIAANTPTIVARANEARLGGTIVNTGTANVTLYLSELGYVQEAETQGYPQIVLTPGQSWDFRLGILLWGGEVVAAATAATTLSLAEV